MRTFLCLILVVASQLPGLSCSPGPDPLPSALTFLLPIEIQLGAIREWEVRDDQLIGAGMNNLQEELRFLGKVNSIGQLTEFEFDMGELWYSEGEFAYPNGQPVGEIREYLLDEDACWGLAGRNQWKIDGLLETTLYRNGKPGAFYLHNIDSGSSLQRYARSDRGRTAIQDARFHSGIPADQQVDVELSISFPTAIFSNHEFEIWSRGILWDCGGILDLNLPPFQLPVRLPVGESVFRYRRFEPDVPQAMQQPWESRSFIVTHSDNVVLVK